MASTFSTSLRLEKQATGDNPSTWGAKANNVFEMIEDAIAGQIDVPVTDSGVATNLPGVNGTVDLPRNLMLKFTGALTADRIVTVPDVTKTYIVRNATTGGFSVTVKILGSAGTKEYLLRNGDQKFLYYDGVSVFTSNDWITQSSQFKRWGIPAYISSAGIMEIGRYIDFHNTDTEALDYAVRLDTDGTTTDIYLLPNGSAKRKIWNDGNGGTGSGLDADKVDGFHAVDLLFPAGTAMLFLQAAAPTGWTKQSLLGGISVDDRILRVVSGTTTIGGTTNASTVFTSARTVSGTNTGTALTTAQLPIHAHGLSAETLAENDTHTHTVTGTAASAGAHTHTLQPSGLADLGGTASYTGGSYQTNSISTTSSNGAHTHTVSGTTGVESASHTHFLTGNTNNAGSGSTHTHTWAGSVNLDVKYLDAIVCTKNP